MASSYWSTLQIDKEKILFLKDFKETGHCVISEKQSPPKTLDDTTMWHYKDLIAGWAQV